MSSVLLTLAPWFHTFSMWSCFHHVHCYNQWQNPSRCLFCHGQPHRVRRLLYVLPLSTNIPFMLGKVYTALHLVLSIFQPLSCKGCSADTDQGGISWQVVMLRRWVIERLEECQNAVYLLMHQLFYDMHNPLSHLLLHVFRNQVPILPVYCGHWAVQSRRLKFAWTVGSVLHLLAELLGITNQWVGKVPLLFLLPTQ